MDTQTVHLFKHPGLGLEDVAEAWRSAPAFYPAKPPAHWLMVAEVSGRTLVIPTAPADSGDRTRYRHIGCYDAPSALIQQYRRDRWHTPR